MPSNTERPATPGPTPLAALATQAGLADQKREDDPFPRLADVEHTDAEGHRWHCRIGFDMLDGQLQPVSFEIRSAEGAGQRRITTALVRSLPVATIEEKARRRLLQQSTVRLALAQVLAAGQGLEPNAAGLALAQVAAEQGLGFDEARRDLQRFRGPESIFLRHVAAIYTNAVKAGDRAPAKAVARAISEWRGQNVTSVAARNWVRRCRQLGLLPAADTRSDCT